MSTSDLHVIVGLGVTGLSSARFLKNKGIAIAVTDSRAAPPNLAAFQAEFPDVPVAVGELSEALLAKAAVIVLSPGIPTYDPLIAAQTKRGVPVIGDVELLAQRISASTPVIAITGTNAKSTVTTLVGKMAEAAGLKVQVGGNLGIPVLDLYTSNPHPDVFVLELSSFQLETTYSLKPAVATILNITPDHMDRYQTLADYQRAKQRVYQHCAMAVCNRDDPLTDSDVSCKFNFTLGKPNRNEFGVVQKGGENYLAFEEQLLMPVCELPVIGLHYQANALASLAIGHGFGLPMEAMLKVLREFPGLAHRCQFVRELNQVKWYNDSKGTNVGATQAAIDGLGSEIQGKLILIAGGLGKHADFSPLQPLIERYVRHVVLIGQAAKEIEAIITPNVSASHANDMQSAVLQCRDVARNGDYVLLSPACASLDMFKNFEHRGEVFMEWVNKL